MMSFITCEPTSSVPTQPNSTQAQGFTSRCNRKAETSCPLPGGRIVESRIASRAAAPGIRDYAVASSAQVSQMLLRAGIKPITDSIDESSFLHLFFLDCEKYRERNLLIKMLFDLRKLVCAK